MKRICPKCTSVNDSKNILIKGSLLLGAPIISLGFLILAIGLYINNYIIILFAVFGMIIGIISTIKYFSKVSKICPKCKYDNMPTINEPEGQKILKEHGMNVQDDSTHRCSNCGYVADGIVQNKTASIVLIIVGILTLPFAPAFNLIALPGSLIFIGTGIYGVWTNYRKNFTCPNCKNNSLVPIDSN